MKELKDESQPFLGENGSLCLRCRDTQSKRSHRTARRWQWIACTAIASNLLMLLVVALVLRVPGRMRCLAQDGTAASLYSPLEEYVRYKEEPGDKALEQQALYGGDPSPESDQAWAELHKHPRLLYASAPEARRLGFQELPSSALMDHGNFAAHIGVFHNLHCLRVMRMYLYDEYYFENRTKEEIREHREHHLHCVEALRSSVACHADLTLYPYLWKDGKPDSELVLNTAINRRCVDLDALKAGMEQRVIS